MKYLAGIILTLISLSVQSQSSQALKRQGDLYFEYEQYFKAMEYYKSALGLDNNLKGAEYQLAECYRLTFDTKSAEVHYGQVVNSSTFRLTIFPLARYYYGLMKKANGEYREASKELGLTVKELKENGLSTDEHYRKYYLQAKTEIEGCRLALRQLVRPETHGMFKPIASPVNSPFNDFAAFISQNDTTIVVSSARKPDKGRLIDFRYGEYFSDFFHFRFNGSQWDEIPEKASFKVNLNSKLGEGAGIYNAAKDKFYYTYCNEEEQGCKIYESEKIADNWSNPTPLNQQINQPGYDSRHPSISPTGDTLFFSSNIPGGQGGFDIWYSVADGVDRWGKPVNLGNYLNTEFDEISPYYYPPGEALFFASSGHRGFGGFDMFMTTGETLSRGEVYNIGAPYNSCRDDCFIVLGEKYGYISSNRLDGYGKFDIYMFSNETGNGLVAGIEADEAIAGRKSLFSDDYHFDSPDKMKIDMIISQFLANKIAGSDLVLSEEELEFYSSLSVDDVEKIDRIVNARYRKITQSELRALQVENEFNYQQLEEKDRDLVDMIVRRRLEQKDLGFSVSLDPETSALYQNTDQATREKIDLIIARLVSKADRNTFVGEVYPHLSPNEQRQVDELSYQYFKVKKNLNNLPLSPSLLLFLKETDSENKIFAAIKERIILLAEDNKFKLTDQDRHLYESLDTRQRDALEDLATTFIVSDVNDIWTGHNVEMIYDPLTGAQKSGMDRILARIINNLTLADLYFAETNFRMQEIALLDAYHSDPDRVGAILDQLSADGEHAHIVETDNKKRLERFLEISSGDWLSGKRPAFFSGRSMPPEGRETVSVKSGLYTGESENFRQSNADIDQPSVKQHPVFLEKISANSPDHHFIIASGQLKDASTGHPVTNFPIGIQLTSGEIEYKTFTDPQGKFEFNNIPARDYNIVAIDPKLYKEADKICHLIIEGLYEKAHFHEVSTALYFNSGESSLRPEAIVTIKEIAEVYKKDPKIRIELHGHTDNEGTPEMNLSLSEERSEETFRYLQKCGVPSHQIFINFHGSLMPVAENINEYGRQLNRRVNVIIQSNSPIAYDPPPIYLVKPKSTLFSISKQFGIDIEDIMTLNGLKEEKINVFQPLRIQGQVHNQYQPDMLVETGISLMK